MTGLMTAKRSGVQATARGPAAGSLPMRARPTPMSRVFRSACACGGTCPRCSGKGEERPALMSKLEVNTPGDAFEQEADRVADQVMRMSDPTGVDQGDTVARSRPAEVLQRHASASQGPSTAPPIVDEALRAPGQPLDAATRAFMEPRFGEHFGRVRIHSDETAAESARAVQARAFTVGDDIVFGKTQYAPQSGTGRRLLAHELAHVVQQTGHDRSQARLQREDTTKTLQGRENECVALEDRALQVGSGTPLSETKTPGGRVIAGTKSSSQNCAGASLCGRQEYINWPHLGLQADDGKARPPDITADWDAANYFVPTGCKPVNCSGISVNASRCRSSEREVIVFLYRWPAGVLRGTSTTVYQSDFHMIGRTPSSLPVAWESKMDRRERVEDIRDPLQSLHDAYPHTLQPDREVKQHCFCCDCGKIVTK